MREFHVFVQADCEAVRPAGALAIEGESFEAWSLADGPPLAPLQVDFDTAYEGLQRLPRLYAEPDGSFVWAGRQDSATWQLFGQLADQGTRLQSVELRGTIPRDQFEELLNVLRWPNSPLMFQLARQGVFLNWEGFARLVWR